MSRIDFEIQLLDALRAGIKRSSDLIALVTDFHGGPVTTEYILTADIARELILRHHQVFVEYANWKLANVHTARRGTNSRKIMGARRTDIVILRSGIIPSALIEIKIGVRTLAKVSADLRKTSDTIDLLKSRFASSVVGAVVYQVHVAGNEKRQWRNELFAEINRIENTIEAELETYRQLNTDCCFEIHPLQEADQGITEREIEDAGYEKSLGTHGHATRH